MIHFKIELTLSLIKRCSFPKLLFFVNEKKCEHIGIYKGDGFYYHSSGMDFGRNGIGLDTLKKSNDKISLHYKSKLISAGRVVRNYRWDRTIR